jgi:bacterial/archaeal transporter family-2 protein
MLFPVALAAFAGLIVPLQALIVARVSFIMASPMLAALVNFVSGTVALVALLALSRTPLPTQTQIAQMPVYGWIVGFLGAFFVAQAAYTIPKLGAAATVALIIAGQMIGSLALDHFGILHSAHPVSAQKAAGALLLLVGVFLILRPVD